MDFALPTQGAQVQFPVHGSKIPHAVWCSQKKRVANSKVLHLCREDPGALANVREKAVQKGKSPQCPKAVNVLVLTKEKRLDSGNCR